MALSVLDQNTLPWAHMVASASDAVLVAEARKPGGGERIVYANEAFEVMSGYRLAELLGKSPRIFQTRHSDPDVLNQVRVAIAEGRYFEGLITNARKDGTLYLVDWKLSPVRSADGRLSHWISIQRDITHEAQQQKELVTSEERLGLTIAASGDGIWDWNVKTGELYWSDRFLDMVGLPADQFVPQVETFFDRLLPDDKARVSREVQAHFTQKVPFETRYRLLREDGTVVDTYARGQASWDKDGNPTRMVGIVRDMTEQNQLRARLLEAEHLAHIGHWSLDAKRLYMVWSPETYRIQGYEPGTFIPTLNRAIRLYHPEDRTEVRQVVMRAVRAGEPFEVDARILRPDGAVRHVRLQGNVAYAPDGTPVEIFGVIQDRTDTVMVQEQLDAAQRMQVFGQMAGGVAHDFNNLLSVISGNLELLKSEVGAEMAPEHLTMLQNAIKAVFRGRDLTQSLLSFARAAPLKATSVKTRDLLDGMESVLTRTLPANVTQTFKVAPDIWAMSVDLAALEAAVMNLVINARDAMPQGGQLVIEAENKRLERDTILHENLEIRAGPYVVISVTDTGTGIAKDHLDRVREPFFTTKPVGQGSGLGLARVSGFAEQSGGLCHIYSEEGQGTSVKLYLPAHALSPDETTRNARHADGKFNGLRILFAEDLDDVRTILAKQLEHKGCQVIAAASGDEALDRWQEDKDFDLLLTDVVMPGTLQGPALARKIRAENPKLPVIFLSGYAREALVHGNGVQAQDLRLMKPISIDDMLDAITSVVSHS